MKARYVFSVLFVTFFQCVAAAWDIGWVDQFGNGVSTLGGGATTDGTGVYVSGSVFGVLPNQVGAGGLDAYIRKYDFGGTALWTRQFGTSGLDTPTLNGVAIHTTGVYVIGNTTGTFPGEPAGSGLDIFIARLDTQTGQLVWIRQFGIRRDVFGVGLGGVAVDDNGVYAASSALQGEITAALIRKYDFGGNLVWARELCGPLSCGPTFWGAATQ